MQAKIKNIVFDLGGVLIDWNPRYLFRKIFNSEDKMEYFLKNICTQEWNEKQDAGRLFADATAELIALFPKYKNEIQAYDQRWEEMLKGPISETVSVLEKLHSQKSHRLLGLSNWSDEKFVVAEKNYPFLKLFEGVVVSGKVKMKKPDPRIYRHLCEHHQIKAEESLFIDDVITNIEAASNLGFQTAHFKSAQDLKTHLTDLQILRD